MQSPPHYTLLKKQYFCFDVPRLVNTSFNQNPSARVGILVVPSILINPWPEVTGEDLSKMLGHLNHGHSAIYVEGLSRDVTGLF